MNNSISFTPDTINTWADDVDGPVALHLKQKLLAVGEDNIIFPPTYADIGYNIDTLSDGTKVALIDSVGSQANRMEPIFKDEPYSKLVPQIEIKYGKQNHQKMSVLEVGHRLGDAVIRSSELGSEVKSAFEGFLNSGDVSKLARLAPTSLIFGVWDSRDTGAKLPRIVQSVIRAWDVDELTRSAQYNPALDYAALGVFSEEDKQKAEGKKGSNLAERGFVHVPATGSHGGVVVRGSIERNITVNLIAIRRLQGGAENTQTLRRYILGLSLVAATAPLENFLRQGCLLVPNTEIPSEWKLVRRDGTSQTIKDLTTDSAFNYAEGVASTFMIGENKTVNFDKKSAVLDTKKPEQKSKTA